MTWLWTLLTANWRERLIIAGILVAMVISVAVWAYTKGKDSVQQAQLKETIKTVEKVRIVHDKVNAMPTGAVHDELRLHWQR